MIVIMKNSKKKYDRKKLKILESQAVSIPSFLAKFLGLKNEELMQANLTHHDLMKLFPNLENKYYIIFIIFINYISCIY